MRFRFSQLRVSCASALTVCLLAAASVLVAEHASGAAGPVSASGEEAAPTGLSSADQAYVALGLRLIGVINSGDQPKAWISMKDLDEEILVGEGDLLGGYTLSRISPDQIEIVRGQERRLLALRHLKIVKADPQVKLYAADFQGANPDRPHSETRTQSSRSSTRVAESSGGSKSTKPQKTVELASSGVPRFRHPMGGRGRVSSTFGYRRRPRTRGGHYGSRYHQGIDVAAPHGTRVCAAAPGKVIARKYSWDRGRYLIIKHSGGYETRYYHLQDRFVREGQYVKAGQLVGREGSTGRTSTGPHLHFEIRKNGRAYNPAQFLKF